MKKYQFHYSSENQGSYDSNELEEEIVSSASGTNVMLVIFSIAVLTFAVFAIVGMKG